MDEEENVGAMVWGFLFGSFCKKVLIAAALVDFVDVIIQCDIRNF